MLTRYRTVVSVLFRATDVMVIVAAWLASYWARFYAIPIEAKVHVSSVQGLRLARATRRTRVGRGLRVLGRLRIRPKCEGGSTKCGSSGVRTRARCWSCVAVAYLYDEHKYSRLVTLYFAAIGAFSLACVPRHVALDSAPSAQERVRPAQACSSSAADRPVDKLVERMAWYPELGIRVIGLVTSTGQPRTDIQRPVFGKFDRLHAVWNASAPTK